MEASQEGHLELVRFLLEYGANVNAVTQTNDTALTYACENGHTDVAELLIQVRLYTKLKGIVCLLGFFSMELILSTSQKAVERL